MSNTLTIPNTAVDGTDILAADYNGNMNAIATFLNSTKLNDDNLKPGGISNISLASSCIQASNMTPGAVAQATLAARTTGTTVVAGGVAISASCGSFTTSSTSQVDVTNLSVTITTTGRPVYVGLISDASGSAAGLSAVNSGFLFLLRGSTVISDAALSSTTSVPPGAVWHLDTGATAGTYTYKLRASVNSGGTNSVSANNCFLIAYEI